MGQIQISIKTAISVQDQNQCKNTFSKLFYFFTLS